MSELARKLGLLPGQCICLLDAPDMAAATIRDACPDGVTIDTALTADRYDAIFFWPAALDGLAARFAALQARIVPDGAVWAVMPKKAFAHKRGVSLTWEEMQAAGLTTDLVDNKIVSLTSEEYATRFVLRKQRRAAHRRE